MNLTRPPEPEAGLTAVLADSLTGLAKQAPAADVAAAVKQRFLHAIRVSLISSRLPPADVALGAVDEVGDGCTVIGRTMTVAAADAAFVNGVVGHSSLMEDCGPGGLREGSHPATYVIPAALASAESCRASGPDLMRGIVVGYETVSRLGAIAPREIVARRFRPLSVMGAFGAAAAVCATRGWTGPTLDAALAIAADTACGSTQGIFEGTMEPYFQAGVAARNGMLAAHLAAAGSITSTRSLEGEFGFFETYGGVPGEENELSVPRDRLGVARLGSKRFAACLQNQETMALIADTALTYDQPDDIIRVVVERPRTGTHGLSSPGVSRVPPFANMLQAQMSARFTVAASLMGQPVDDPRFFQRAFADPVLTALSGRVELVPRDANCITVTVETSNGEQRVMETDGARSLFPTAEVSRRRFLDDVGAAIGVDEASQLLSAIDALEDVGDVRTITETLRAHGRREKVATGE